MNVIEEQTLHIDGVKYFVQVEPDLYTTPADYEPEVYGEATVQAWRDDRWQFVTVVVTPECNCCGQPDTARAESQSAIEYGELIPGEFITISTLMGTHVPDMVADFIPEGVTLHMVPAPAELGFGADAWYSPDASSTAASAGPAANPEVVLQRLYEVADSGQTTVLDDLARAAGLTWTCDCGWSNAAGDSRCGGHECDREKSEV